MRNQLLAPVVLAAALCLNPTPSEAQSGADKATAEQLFTQGRALMKKGDYAAACPKFEASLKLDPAVGTTLNLAICYEKLGKLASAWGYYREAENLANRAGRSRREEYARNAADALEPRLPRLVIKIDLADHAADLTVTRNGTPVNAAVFNTAIFVDPGAYQITADASGYLPFTASITAIEGREVTVEVPVLAPAPEDTVKSPEKRTAIPTVDAPSDRPEPGHTGRTRRIMGLSVAGGGLAALAVGIGFGASANSKWDGAFDDGLCNRDTLVCTAEGQSQTDSARTHATVSTALVGAGIALAAAGAVLYLTAPKNQESYARLAPSAGPGQLGLVVVGGF